MEDGTHRTLTHTCDTPEAQHLHQTLELVGNKWSILIVTLLGGGPLRFSQLKREIEPISQRMLTRTLRRLEEQRLVSREVFPTIPPRVEYRLTPSGCSLMTALGPLFSWARSECAAASVKQPSTTDPDIDTEAVRTQIERGSPPRAAFSDYDDRAGGPGHAVRVSSSTRS